MPQPPSGHIFSRSASLISLNNVRKGVFDAVNQNKEVALCNQDTNFNNFNVIGSKLIYNSTLDSFKSSIDSNYGKGYNMMTSEKFYKRGIGWVWEFSIGQPIPDDTSNNFYMIKNINEQGIFIRTDGFYDSVTNTWGNIKISKDSAGKKISILKSIRGITNDSLEIKVKIDSNDSKFYGRVSPFLPTYWRQMHYQFYIDSIPDDWCDTNGYFAFDYNIPIINKSYNGLNSSGLYSKQIIYDFLDWVCYFPQFCWGFDYLSNEYIAKSDQICLSKRQTSTSINPKLSGFGGNENDIWWPSGGIGIGSSINANFNIYPAISYKRLIKPIKTDPKIDNKSFIQSESISFLTWSLFHYKLLYYPSNYYDTSKCPIISVKLFDRNTNLLKQEFQFKSYANIVDEGQGDNRRDTVENNFVFENLDPRTLYKIRVDIIYPDNKIVKIDSMNIYRQIEASIHNDSTYVYDITSNSAKANISYYPSNFYNSNNCKIFYFKLWKPDNTTKIWSVSTYDTSNFQIYKKVNLLLDSLIQDTTYFLEITDGISSYKTIQFKTLFPYQNPQLDSNSLTSNSLFNITQNSAVYKMDYFSSNYKKFGNSSTLNVTLKDPNNNTINYIQELNTYSVPRLKQTKSISYSSLNSNTEYNINITSTIWLNNSWLEVSLGYLKFKTLESANISNLNNSDYFSLYPNPTKDKIILLNKTQKTNFKISNILGQSIKFGEFIETINVSDLENGFYILEYSSHKIKFQVSK